MENQKNDLKHVFLPTPENNQHPHVLRREAVITALSFVLLIEALVLSQSFFGFRAPEFMASIFPAAVTTFTNDARIENHLAPLTVNPILATAARAKALDMAEKGYFAHVSPDGTVPWTWVTNAGYKYQYAGENLAANFTDSEDVVTAWLNSPTHRANLLGTQYTEIGIGMATGTYKGHETVFVVQYFGKPIPGSAPAGAKTVLVPRTSTSTPRVGTSTPRIATSSTIVVTATSAPTLVLGSETSAPISSIGKVFASPRKSTETVLFVIGAFCILLLILAVVYRARLPRGSATVGALSIAILAFALLIGNKELIAGSVVVPAEGGTASVYQAIPDTLPEVAPEGVKG